MDTKNLKIIFIPGNGGGSINDGWFPYIKKELEKLGLTVVSRDFPDPILAREKYWLPFLKNELKADQHIMLIGHSSGAIAVMRFAENNKIYGSILIGAYYTDLGDKTEKLSGYFGHPWKWQNIKNNQNWIVQFASTDDPYISIEEARFVRDNLKTEYHEYIDQGHFGEDKGKTEFPEIVEIIKGKIQ